MATSEFWQRVSASVSSSPEWVGGSAGDAVRSSRGTASLWMALDALTILGSAVLATLYQRHTGPVAGVEGFWHGTLFHGRSMEILLALLCGFAISLIVTSRRLHLYSPARLTSFLHEQRLSVQACFTSGLLLTGTLYLVHAEDIPRSIVLITVGLVTVALSLRRLIYRIFLYRRFERGVGTRNVLIVGTGPEAHALRHHLESIRHLGYTFKGFIDFPGPLPALPPPPATWWARWTRSSSTPASSLWMRSSSPRPASAASCRMCWSRRASTALTCAWFPTCTTAWPGTAPSSTSASFPTIPLHRGHVPEMGLLLKRVLDIVFSSLALILLSPLLLAIAIAVKLDSRGPVFYSSERIGKKGRVFRCIKFRTMVRDAEKRRADVMHMNERDGVLFKISNDPRITKLGRFLRKYSLDELPQFFNVLRGDMSIVGPRPPHCQRGAGVQAEPSAPPRRDAGHHRPVAGAGAPGSLV